MTGLAINLAEVASAVGAPVRPGWEGVTITGVNTDSRTIEPGQLFFALRGEKFDGHDYIAQASQHGATAMVVSNQVDRGLPQPQVLVADTLQALGDLAGHLRRRRVLKVIALTGSNGKTTTKEMIARILSRGYRTLATKGNFNNLVGLPLTLFRLTPEHEVAVLEMGMNREGEIARLTHIARPDVGLITNIGMAHVEGLGSIEGIALAKGELFRGLNPDAVAVVNADDPRVVAQAAAFPGRCLTFGFSRGAEIRARYPRIGMNGTTFHLETAEGMAPIRLALYGRHNVADALAAAAACSALGMGLTDIADGLKDFPPYPGRLVLKHLPGSILLLDDTYNANPTSTEAALRVLKSFRRIGARLIAALGDMLELGPVSRQEHARIGRLASELGVDMLVAVGPAAAEMAKASKRGATKPKKVKWFAEPEQAAAWLNQELRPHDRVLVKGSRGMAMERLVKPLCGEE